MLGLATVPFLMLFLLVLFAESEAAIQLTTENSKCGGYWDRSNNYHCSSQSASAAGPSSAGRQLTSPLSRNNHPACATSEDTGKLPTQKSTTPGLAAERASQSTSGSKEDFPKVGVKPQDGVVESVRSDHIAQTSEISQVLPPATSPPGEGSEQKVDQTGQEPRASEGQSGELGKGGNAISGKQVSLSPRRTAL
ncbi:uncharacterized protein TEOVI_000013800 [Trypanosoma equiperdum]|uniref:Expression site-associated gene 9 (ESAG9) protein n=1 Tax=Trypanosoma equiperdum TaxID=5694 RepID=A0A1G4I024_TRYEQ|nr:hypothetical protein TEOVI_000013800 [Trypanosoma equiperdum]